MDSGGSQGFGVYDFGGVYYLYEVHNKIIMSSPFPYVCDLSGPKDWIARTSPVVPLQPNVAGPHI